MKGLLGLWNSFRKKRMENATKPSFNRDAVILPEPTQPQFTLTFFSPKKGKEIVLFFLYVYGRFLSSNNASKAPTMIIAVIMPMDIGRKYISAIDRG